MTDPTQAERGTCKTCGGFGWVCERHPDTPWDGEGECGCGAPGMPCGSCERELAASGYVDAERAAVVAWLRDESRQCHNKALNIAESGEDDRASMFVGWSSAYAFVASRIERAEHLSNEAKGG